MDTNQIEAFCDVRYKSVFLGFIPIDGLKDDRVVQELCEHFIIGKFVIFNIDPSDKPGRHWVLLCRLKNGTLFMFDSFGAVVTDRVFNFKTFGEQEKAINLDYTPTMKGQLFQYDYDFVKYVFSTLTLMENSPVLRLRCMKIKNFYPIRLLRITCKFLRI